MHSRNLILVLLVALAVLSAGCSGGETPETGTTPTPAPGDGADEQATATATETPRPIVDVSVSGVGGNRTITEDRANVTVYGVENEVRIEDTHVVRLEVRDNRNVVVIGPNCAVDSIMISGDRNEIRIPEELDPEVQDSGVGTTIERY